MRNERVMQIRVKVGSALLGLLFVLSATVSWIAPQDPDRQHLETSGRLQAPSVSHPFGTDQLGRDVLSRVLHGSRISLGLALITMLLAVILGTSYGALSGYVGGATDRILMRFVDLFLTFPLIFFVATCIALFGNQLSIMAIILALTAWMDIARLVRGDVLVLKRENFVLRARTSGLPVWRIFLRYVLPATLPTVTAAAVLRMADLILIESAMSFLGLGVQPPTATWGTILKDGRHFLSDAWWLAFFPGVAILLACLSLYLIGEGFQKHTAKQIQSVR